MTGTTVVTREPEWDDEQRELAASLDDWESHIHGACGTHMAQAMDPTVNRDVQRAKAKCLDCDAIEAARKTHHKQERHTKDKCDCDDWVYYVAKYIPRDD